MYNLDIMCMLNEDVFIAANADVHVFTAAVAVIHVDMQIQIIQTTTVYQSILSLIFTFHN